MFSDVPLVIRSPERVLLGEVGLGRLWVRSLVEEVLSIGSRWHQGRCSWRVF